MHNGHTIEINHLWCGSLSVDFNVRHLSTSATIVVVESEDLELLVLRDNWLVTNRKVNLQLGNDSLVVTKVVLQSNNQPEVNQLANNLSDTLSSRTVLTKSTPSWTITQIM
jgi:hypothetical protein